jgi:PAS domain S-box-containing protein
MRLFSETYGYNIMRSALENVDIAVPPAFSGCGIFSFSVGSRTLTCSDELMHMLGTQKRPATRSEIAQGVHPEDRAAFERFLDAGLTHPDLSEREFRVPRRDGSVGVLNIRLRQDNSAPREPVVHGLAIDVTNSRQTQGSGSELAAATASGIGHYQHDFRKRSSWWSTAAYRLFDIAPGPALDPHGDAIKRIHDGDREAVLRMIERASRHQGPYEMTFRVVKPDGSIRWVLDRGESFGPLDPATGRIREARGIMVDVTDQIRPAPSSGKSALPLDRKIENAPFGVIEVDADLCITQLSEEAEQTLAGNGPLIGTEIGVVMHRMWNDAFAADAVARYRHTLETGEPYRSALMTEKRRHNDTTESYDWTLERIVMPDGRYGVVCHFYNLTEQAEEASTLRNHAEELREILDSAVAFIGMLDPDGTLTEANQPALAAGGLERSDVIDKKFWKAWWWSYDNAVAARLKAAIAQARAGEVVRYDADVRMAGGVLMSIDFMLAPIKDATGKVVRIVASGFDITERKQSEKHIRLLMEEINHRSKNVLSLVQSIARLSGGREQGGFMAGFEGRLQALAASYDLLLEDRSAGVDLNDLITAQLAHVSDATDSRVTLKGPSLKITAEAAQGLGMAIHELATNAAKYGALSGDRGHVTVVWQHGDATGTGFEISWREMNGPPVVAPQRTGFGSTVLGPMAEKALRGEVQLTYAPEGVVWQASSGQACLVG